MNEQAPVENRRGMDPKWNEERRSWGVAQVAAPGEQVADSLSNMAYHFEHAIYDAFEAGLEFADKWGRLVFVYQLQGREWTVVDGRHIPWDIAERLSRQMSTKAMFHAYENTGGVSGAELWENGREIESFFCGITGEFDDDPRAARDEKIAEGWILSADNCRGFRSERLSDADLYKININDETLDLGERMIKDFGLYVPCDVWKEDSKTGHITLADDWSKQDFQDAKILLSAY